MIAICNGAEVPYLLSDEAVIDWPTMTDGGHTEVNGLPFEPAIIAGVTLPQGTLARDCERVDGMIRIKASVATQLAYAKSVKNLQINEWRMQANFTSFPHAGKHIACDELSRSDIDAVAGSISLTDAFPAGFPMGWKAIDNTYIALPDTDAFKAMYASMTAQGSTNFARSQALKAQVAAATSQAQLDALTWE